MKVDMDRLYGQFNDRHDQIEHLLHNRLYAETLDLHNEVDIVGLLRAQLRWDLR